MAPCPVPGHKPTSTTLAISPGKTHDRPVLMCHAGCSFNDIIAALQQRRLWPKNQRPPPPPTAEQRAKLEADRQRRAIEEQRDAAKRIDAARNIWNASAPIADGDLVDRYLIRRGLGAAWPWPPSLRIGRYQGHTAMIAGVARWPDDLVVAVQITLLREPGIKAAATKNKPARITRGVFKQGAVRLAPLDANEPIFLTEGTEDALAIVGALKRQAWAVLGTSNAAKVIVPKNAAIILAMDGDQAGQTATKNAEHALTARGHRVRSLALPTGVDPASIFAEKAANNG